MIMAKRDRTQTALDRLAADVEPLALLRDPALLAAAGMRPSRSLRRLATAVRHPAHLQRALRALDDRAMQASMAATAEAPR